MALVTKSFSDIITFTRTGTTATYFNSAGVLVNAGANVPRFDYNPATLAAQGLLIEEQRTNLFVRSAEFNDAAWQKNNSTVSANVAVSPDGGTNADKLEETAVTNFFGVVQNPTASFSTTYTWSCFAKAAERNQLVVNFSAITNCQICFNIANGSIVSQGAAIISATTTSVGNGWFRLTATFTTPSSGSNLLYNIAGPALNGNATYAGVAGFGIFIWGAQLEAGAFPTSYIPTTTTALTRSADVANVNNLAPWFNSTGSTLYAEWTNIAPAIPTGVFQVVVNLADALNNNFYRVFQAQGAGAKASTNMFSGGVNPGRIDAGGAYSNATVKAASAFAVLDRALAANGGAAVTSATGALPVGVTLMNLGTDGASYINGWLRRITYYPRRLSNAELQALTV